MKIEDYSINEDLMKRIIKYIEKYDCNMSYGFDCNSGEFILVTDWNKKKFKSLDNWLSGQYHKGVQVLTGFDDQYTHCSGCNGLICTTPMYYGDTGRYQYIECDILCKNCILEDPEEIIENCLNDSNKAIPDYLTDYIKDQGFVCFSNDDNYCPIYETGFHIGQNDNPKDIEKKIKELKHNYDYLFMINSVGQFDVQWSVFIKRVEE